MTKAKMSLGHISLDTHTRVKTFCALTHRRINEVIDQAVIEYLERRQHDFDMLEYDPEVMDRLIKQLEKVKPEDRIMWIHILIERANS